jgi:hypothetical protein
VYTIFFNEMFCRYLGPSSSFNKNGLITIDVLGHVWLPLFFLTYITSNVVAHTWSTKYRLITCMSAQIKSNLRDESIKPN